jgi:hypothetical protein
MTIEIVDEPLTKGIDEHLPWVRDREREREWVLDEGLFYRLNNIISRGDFIRGA